jgi:hypothetical protein
MASVMKESDMVKKVGGCCVVLCSVNEKKTAK